MSRRFGCLVLVLLAGCNFDFERMQVQRRVNQSADDPDRLALMEHAQASTQAVPHDRDVGPPESMDGCSGTSYVDGIPVEASAELLKLGASHFLRFCAACHGPSGNGSSMVADAMERSKPKSFLVPPVRDYPPGRIYRTLMLGYKLMPSYRNELNVRERWAVVAYVKALQKEAAATVVPGKEGPAAAVSPGPVCAGGAP
jgi:mono/diheme cytochrome c family protein